MWPTSSTVTPSNDKSMGSPVSPRPLSLSLSLRSLLWSVGITYGHSYTMTHFLYSLFPRPLVAISNFSLYHHRHTKECEIVQHWITQILRLSIKNNTMRHEESRDVDSSGQACTTRSHIWSSPEVRLPTFLLLSHLKRTTPCSSLFLTVPTSGDDCRSHSLQESSSSFWTLSASQHRW